MLFEVHDRDLIGHPTPGGHRYCCTKELVPKTKCFQDRLIYQAGALPQPQPHTRLPAPPSRMLCHVPPPCGGAGPRALPAGPAGRAAGAARRDPAGAPAADTGLPVFFLITTLTQRRGLLEDAGSKQVDAMLVFVSHERSAACLRCFNLPADHIKAPRPELTVAVPCRRRRMAGQRCGARMSLRRTARRPAGALAARAACHAQRAARAASCGAVPGMLARGACGTS